MHPSPTTQPTRPFDDVPAAYGCTLAPACQNIQAGVIRCKKQSSLNRTNTRHVHAQCIQVLADRTARVPTNMFNSSFLGHSSSASDNRLIRLNPMKVSHMHCATCVRNCKTGSKVHCCKSANMFHFSFQGHSSSASDNGLIHLNPM